MDVERLERAARDLRAEALRYFTLRELLPTEGIVRAATALDEALAAPEPAQEPVDTLCLFCRTELDPDEMDDGSDLPPLAPGVCSECFQRWHDEPVWRKRLKEAADKPAQADPWAWAVLLPGNTPQQARIRMTEREATSCAAELPGFVIVPLYAAPSRPGGAS